jgi:putative tryptophan/tyrosine transport system substrate-binding protein
MALGYVGSLAKPSGNMTGVFFRQLELTGKRLQLLKESFPEVTCVAVFWDTFSADQLRETEAAARRLGVRLQPVGLRDPPYDYDRAFSVAERRAHALLGLVSPLFSRPHGRACIIDLALQNRLPAIFFRREMVEAGALMAYGAA